MQPLYPHFVFGISGAGLEEILDTLVEDTLNKTHYLRSMNPAVLVILTTKYFGGNFQQVGEVHHLGRQGGVPWLRWMR